MLKIKKKILITIIYYYISFKKYVYIAKWWSVMPHNMKEESEESKIFNFISNETWSLRCRSCYPSCNDVRYFLQTSSIVLRNNGQTSFL
jgi:hypothetical protein